MTLVALFKTASLVRVDSDFVQNVLTSAAILHGDVLLHGWILGADNFYLSDNPFFLLGRLLWGRGYGEIYGPPFLIYLFLLAAASLIVLAFARDGVGRWLGLAALLFYLATPGMRGMAPIVLVGAQHIAVLAFCLWAWLALARIAVADRVPAGAVIAYAVAAFVALFSDPMANVIFLLPTLVGLAAAALAPA